jgi:hypothetical protein
MHPPLGMVVQQRGGHLGAAGVVDANEQHLGNVFDNGSVRLGQGTQLLPGEAVHNSGMKSTTRAPCSWSMDSLT